MTQKPYLKKILTRASKTHSQEVDAFTMIELVFIIVILGILASIAIPRLAASRDDALAVTLKSDIGTILQAVPAIYMSQGDKFVNFSQAIQLDSSLWNDNGNIITSSLATQNGVPCVQIEYKDAQQDIPAQNIIAGNKILEISIQENDKCITINRLFHSGGVYTRIINLSGYGIHF